MKVLVTGASGFVGRALCQALNQRNHEVTAAVRSPEVPTIAGAARQVAIGDIGPDTDWSEALAGQQAVLHLAARAHVMNETSADPESLYRRVNVEGTRSLAAQALANGVRRLLFLSSIKVNGEATSAEPYRETSPAAPMDAYGRTKRDAEQLLRQNPELIFTIIRSPLVYGPGVRGNFYNLMRLCDRGWPVPVACISNQRSLIGLDNLVDALILTLENEASAGQTFLVCDGEDVSTPELFRCMARALGNPSRLIPIPVALLRLAGVLTGKTATIDRLCGSLQIDSSQIRRQLGWSPPTTLQQGLEKAANWYQNHRP